MQRGCEGVIWAPCAGDGVSWKVEVMGIISKSVGSVGLCNSQG